MAVSGALLIAAILCLAAYSIWYSRNEALRESESASQTLAHVIEVQTQHAFAAVELSLDNIESALRLIPLNHPARAGEIHALMRSMADSQPHVRAFFVTDARGVIIHASDSFTASLPDSSGREYFRAHLFDANHGFYIGAPLPGGTGKNNFISASRRIGTPGGGFGGVVVAVIESDYFQTFYSRLSAGKDGSIALFLRYGTLLFRGPPAPEALGKSYAGTGPFREPLSAAPAGAYRASSAIDGVKRVFAYRVIDGLPLVVLVGVSEREALAGWHRYSGAVALLALAAMLTIMGLTGFLARETGRREALASSLRESEQRYRYLFEANPHPMYIYDTETLRFLAVNEAAVWSYGYTREDFAALSIADMHPAEDVPAMLLRVRHRNPNQVNDHQVRHSRKDGSILEVEVKSGPIFFGGRVARLVLANDITERRNAEIERARLAAIVENTDDAIIKLNAELEQRVIERTAELETANKELESFAYSVSHDLRVPLRSIDGFSKALLDDYQDRLDPTALDYLRRVRAASQRMATLIDDLLLLSRITRGEMKRTKIDLSAMAEDIVSELAKGQPRREVTFSAASGIIVSADAGLMRVALDNLLGNAWKFTGRQPRAMISFSVEIRDGHPVYFIRDNGAGFDMKYADKLFGAFQRLHRDAEFSGTGVGLAIVQRIINRHGGKIWAEAAVGKGATFFFTLGD